MTGFIIGSLIVLGVLALLLGAIMRADDAHGEASKRDELADADCVHLTTSPSLGSGQR